MPSSVKDELTIGQRAVIKFVRNSDSRVVVSVVQYNDGYKPFEGRKSCRIFDNVDRLNDLPVEALFSLLLLQHLPSYHSKSVGVTVVNDRVVVDLLANGKSTLEDPYEYFISTDSNMTFYVIEEGPVRYQTFAGRIVYNASKVASFVCQTCGEGFKGYAGMTAYRQCLDCKKDEEEERLMNSATVTVSTTGPSAREIIHLDESSGEPTPAQIETARNKRAKASAAA